MESYFKKTKRKSLFGKIVWGIFVTMMLLTSAALITAYSTTILNPYKYWIPAFLGLIAPILMLFNCIFMLLMGIRLSRWIIVPLVTFLIGISYLGDFIQVQFITKYPEQTAKKSQSEITVMSYNIRGFSQYGKPKVNTIDQITKYVKEVNPDIVCFQEYQVRNSNDSITISEKLADWKYRIQSDVIKKGNYKWGLAIYSKLPLTNAQAIKFGNLPNSSMSVDVLLGKDTIRLFNNHLQSTQLNKMSRAKLQQGDPGEAARTGSTLRQNYGIRALQADTIATIVTKSPHPIILVGDLNETAMSYVYHTIKGDLKDSFRESGQGYQYTYIPLRRLFRIDYILHSEKFNTISYDSPLVKLSDHKPVIVKMKLKND